MRERLPDLNLTTDNVPIDELVAGLRTGRFDAAFTRPPLLGLVAAGVGVTRLARSARSIRRTGVVFVPLADDHAETVVAWTPTREGPVLRNLLDVIATLTGIADLTSEG